MWKIVILSILAIVQATDIQEFYGNWVQAAFYPVSTYIPICIRFTFSKGRDNVQCTYDDGRNAHYVAVDMLTKNLEVKHNYSMPLMIVNTPAEVMPVLNMTCKCDGKDVRDHGVVRLVNKNYFIMYVRITPSMEYTRSETEPNTAFLFAKKVVPETELLNVMTSIEELKTRRGAVMCVTENYHGELSDENEVL